MTRKLAVPAVIAAVAAALLVGLLVGRYTAARPAASPQAPSVPAQSSTQPSPPAAARATPAGEPSSEGGDVDDSGDAAPAATPYSQTADAQKRWQPVVVGFAKSFVKTNVKDDRTWTATLRPYSTTAVQRQLATVDLRNVPRGRYTSFDVAEYDEQQLAARVFYTDPKGSAWAMVLYVIDDGAAWRVYRYDQYEE